MEHFRSAGFVTGDTLVFGGQDGGAITLIGEIECAGGLRISVIKNITVLEGDGLDALVQTERYAYNAWVCGRFNLLRSDNMHGRPGHADDHHKHVFDWRTGAELPGSPSWVGEDAWPTLGDFIQEVSDWYWEHREELPSLPLATRVGPAS